MKSHLLVLALVCGLSYGHYLGNGKGNGNGNGNNAGGENGASGRSFSQGQLKQFCDDLPSTAGMDAFGYHMAHCEDNPDGPGCSKDGEDVDLSVLTYNMLCLQRACEDYGTDGESLAAMDMCFDQMAMQFKNVLQFTPEGYEQQKDKACSCSYDQVERQTTEDELTGVCDLRWVYGCDPLGRDVDTSNNTIPTCMNGVAGLYANEECAGSLEEDATSTQQLIEYFRIKKLCEVSVKSMLMSEEIVTPVCREQAQRQEKLVFGCTSKCYTDVQDRILLSKYQYVSYDPDYSTEYFDQDCGQFKVDEQLYYSNMVIFQGKQGMWEASSHLCREFRSHESRKVPAPLQYSPFPRNIVPHTDIEDALNICCDERINGENPYDSRELGEQSLHGKSETECLEAEGVFVDYGFMPGLLRGVVSKYHKKDWRTCSEFDDQCTPTEAREDGNLCARELEKEDQMELKGGQAGPDQIFWFLRYLNDDDESLEAKGFALKACSDGARIGRTTALLPGLALGLEAQDYALKVESGKQTVSMLAYFTCAVFSSVHNNYYFDVASPCNDNVLDINVDRETACGY